MNAEILQIISTVAFILGGILLVITVLLFFVLDVRGLANDLSGRTEQRQILKLREQNRQREDGNENRLLFDVTAKLEEAEQETAVLKDMEGTTILASEEDTTLLSENNLVLNVIVIHTKERI